MSGWLPAQQDSTGLRCMNTIVWNLRRCWRVMRNSARRRGVQGLTPTRRSQHLIQDRFGTLHQAAHHAHHATALVLLDHLADDDLFPGRQVRASGGLPGRQVRAPWKALTEAAGPSTAASRAPVRAQFRTLSASRRMRSLSRWAPTTPPNHSRALTISAIAIHTIPCCKRTRISSACTCSKDRQTPRTR